MNSPSNQHDSWLRRFAQFEKRVKVTEPGWLLPVRKAAFARFMDTGFPTTQNADWRFTRIDPIANTPFQPAEPGDGASRSPLFDPYRKLAGQRLVFDGGHYRPGDSATSDLPASIRAGNLAAHWESLPEWLRPASGGNGGDAFTELNTAFFEDGAFLNVERNSAFEPPLHLLFLAPSAAIPLFCHPRNVIVVGESCHVTLIETYAGEDQCVYLTNALTDLIVGPNSTVRYYRLQQEGTDGYHVGTVRVHLDRASVLDATSLSLGGRIARINWNVALNGPGIECTLNGLAVTSGRQHVDHHLRVDHRQPRCTSRELFKGILDGQSRGVFDGKITVQPNAQKTDARQTNRNLLLSDDATANAQPHLEIRADDVKCTHGATVGQLDEEALFYLRARGISEDDARGLLTMAFAREVLDRIPVNPLRVLLEEALSERLAHSTTESISAGERGAQAPHLTGCQTVTNQTALRPSNSPPLPLPLAKAENPLTEMKNGTSSPCQGEEHLSDEASAKAEGGVRLRFAGLNHPSPPSHP